MGDENMKVQAVVFDLDDTLLADQSAADAAILHTCRIATDRYAVPAEALHGTVRKTAREFWYAGPAYGYAKIVGISSWEGLWLQIRTPQEESAELAHWLPSYRHRVWQESLANHGVNDEKLAAELSDAFEKHKRQQDALFEDAEPTLQRLSATHRLALLTNGALDLQRDKIAMANLERYFEAIAISGELGVGKPDPRPFELIHRRLGLGYESTVMVGDGLKTDIDGARGIGMRNIWLNRDGKQPDGEIIPDLEIPNLSLLVEILVSGG
jgi:putative hydrolase of the HAD superfamily